MRAENVRSEVADVRDVVKYNRKSVLIGTKTWGGSATPIFLGGEGLRIPLSPTSSAAYGYDWYGKNPFMDSLPWIWIRSEKRGLTVKWCIPHKNSFVFPHKIL